MHVQRMGFGLVRSLRYVCPPTPSAGVGPVGLLVGMRSGLDVDLDLVLFGLVAGAAA